MLKSWRGWVVAVGAELEARGARELAHNLRACGSTARVRPCDACGDACGAVEVRASCGLRCCPWCARLAAQDKLSLVGAAVERVEAYQTQRLGAAVERVEGERAEAQRAVDYWTKLAAVARAVAREERLDGRLGAAARKEAVAERHDARALAAAQRVALAARERNALRDFPSWSWKLVTITTRWNPLDAREYEPRALRRRVAAALDSWRRVWDAGARAGGLAAATVRVELAPHGMVHIHALYRGPYVDQSWWQKVAGVIVNIKAITDFRGGMVEAVKYTLKLPTPAYGQWLGGDARRVLHPRLAAAWLIATRRQQLLRHVGVMREAVEAVEACGGGEAPERPTGCGCASCGADLTAVQPVLCSTAAVARYLGPRWRLGPPHPDVHGRALPRRVTLCRAPW